MDYSKYYEQIVNIGSGILAILAITMICVLIMVILPYFNKYIDSTENKKKKEIENIINNKIKEIKNKKD